MVKSIEPYHGILQKFSCFEFHDYPRKTNFDLNRSYFARKIHIVIRNFHHEVNERHCYDSINNVCMIRNLYVTVSEDHIAQSWGKNYN